jgi:hypothetical protein
MTMKPNLFIAALLLTVPVTADEPFNGRDTSNWEAKKEAKGSNRWVVGVPSLDPANPKKLAVAAGGEAMINNVGSHGEGWDIYTKEKWGGKFRLEVELMVPQGSNSGVYVMGEYEVQVLDSWGKPDDPPERGGHRRDLQRGRAESQRLEEARRMAEICHRFRSAEIRCRRKENRQCEVPESRTEWQGST